jgi:GMP synthase (glutamine-hydrolysing)
VQAMRHESRPLFGVQFHPEVEHTQHGLTIFRNFVRICERARSA